jgi:hypothetical protein
MEKERKKCVLTNTLQQEIYNHVTLKILTAIQRLIKAGRGGVKYVDRGPGQLLGP